MRAHAQPMHRQAARIARPHVAARPPSGAAVRAILHGPRIQPKLKIGAANDPAETEADRVADQVMRMPAVKTTSATPPTPVDVKIVRRICSQSDEEAQRKPTEESVRRMEDEDEELVRPKEEPGEAPAISALVESAIAGLRGGGAPLSASERAFFEPRFGRSFGNVRLHLGAAADTGARAINARAFTLGNDIAFAEGEYSPGSSEGRRLMAHELTHVIRQSSVPPRRSMVQRREGLGRQVPGDMNRGASKSEEAKTAYLKAFSNWWEERDTRTLQKLLGIYIHFHTVRVGIASSAGVSPPDSAAYQAALVQFAQARQADIIQCLLKEPKLGIEAWEETLDRHYERMQRYPELVALKREVEPQLLPAYAQQELPSAAGRPGHPTQEIQHRPDLDQVQGIISVARSDFYLAAKSGVESWTMPHVRSAKWPEILSGGSMLSGAIGSIVTIGVVKGSVVATAGVGLALGGIGLGIAGILASLRQAEEAERRRKLEHGLKREARTGYAKLIDVIKAKQDTLALLCAKEASQEKKRLNEFSRDGLRIFVWNKMFGTFPQTMEAGMKEVEKKMHRELDPIIL